MRVAQTVTLIPGDGIGPDLTDSVKEVIGALDVEIEWEIAEAGETVMDEEGTPLPESVLESIEASKWISNPDVEVRGDSRGVQRGI